MASGIGLYVGDERVVAVRVSGSSKAPKIDGYAEALIPEAAPKEPTVSKGRFAFLMPERPPVSKAIREVCEKIRVRHQFIYAAVDPEHAVTRYFLMPEIQGKDKGEAIQYEAMRFSPFKMSEVVVDYREHQEEYEKGAVTATAVRKRGIQSLVMAVKKAGIGLEEVETVPDALGRYLKLTGKFDPNVSQGLIFMKESGGVQVLIFKGSVIKLARDFSLSDDFETDRHKLFDEIKASADYYLRLSQGEYPQKIFMTGYGPLTAWRDFLNTAFVSKMNFEIVQGLPDLPPETPEPGGLVLAAGLAMRGLERSSPFGTSVLLPRENRQMKPGFFYTILVAEFVLVFLIAMIVQTAFIQPIGRIYLAQKQELDRSAAAMGNFSESTAQQLRVQKTAVENRVETLKKFNRTKIPMAAILTRISETIPRPMWLDEITVAKGGEEKGPGVFVLRGMSYYGNYQKETTAINEWLQKIGDAKEIQGRFPPLAVQELRQDKMYGKDLTRFAANAVAEERGRNAGR
ncbi:MAG: pilus assembly protein PilM [Candidatus Omnitrophota bacterium]